MNINSLRIKLLTAKSGFTLSLLAEKAGISRQTLSTSLTRNTCRADTALKIAQALEIPLEQLIEKEI